MRHQDEQTCERSAVNQDSVFHAQKGMIHRALACGASSQHLSSKTNDKERTGSPGCAVTEPDGQLGNVKLEKNRHSLTRHVAKPSWGEIYVVNSRDRIHRRDPEYKNVAARGGSRSTETVATV